MMLLTGQPRLAERDAAVHAARALLRRRVVVEREDELAVVAHALADRLAPLRRSAAAPEAGDLAHVRSFGIRLRRAALPLIAARACCRRRLRGCAFDVHLRQRAHVLVREHLDELARASRPSRRASRARRVQPVKRRWRSISSRSMRLVGAPAWRSRALARGGQLASRPACCSLPAAPARARPSRCCSASRTCRRRRRRRRCRRSCRRRNCARCGRARRRCRRSCIRSRGRRCLRRPRVAPELRTQKRSPATPRKYASPSIAPYITVLPMTMLSSGFAGHVGIRIDDDAAARQSLADVVVASRPAART